MRPDTLSAGAQASAGAEVIVEPRLPLFDKILIANRGEIACRIIRTAHRLGIRTVAVYSEADSNALHVAMADESVCIGAASARDSYLDASRIVEACRQTGVQAVHPGYGFLSESADFARRIAAEGLVFIGPGHRSIAAMSDKVAAKLLAIQANVNVIPGWNAALASPGEAVEVARTLGYPVMIKASAGGGGRGLRVARNDTELVEAFASCRREALSSFGDDRLFIERLISGARHIEVQILADLHGNCVHLWERECSIQRRHQKLIEEAPSPFLDESTRTQMCEQAVALAKAADYCSAGTVEFLVEANGSFYFLEMNTRLQVEHPVTECLTGLDLVEQMIRVAAGERLAFSQSEVRRRGWAMECRINADNPARNFLPSAGRLVRYQAPDQTLGAPGPAASSSGIRVDSGMREGDVVSTHYDSLIGKVIAHGQDRAECIGLMREALNAFVIRGVASNVGFQAALLAHPEFRAGRFTTEFIAENYAGGFVASVDLAEEGFLGALAVALHRRLLRRDCAITGQQPGFKADVDGDYVVVEEPGTQGCRQLPATACREGATVHVGLAGVTYSLTLLGSMRDHAVRGTVGGVPFTAQAERKGLTYWVARNGSQFRARVMSPAAAALAAKMPAHRVWAKSTSLVSPMPGRLMKVMAVPGQRVHAGERLAVVEAMKMENVLVAAENATVVSVEAKEGVNLTVDQLILRLQ